MTSFRKWPPYVVAALTFVAMYVTLGMVFQLVVTVAVAKGALPGPPSPEKYKAALDAVLGSAAKTLALSVVLNAFVVSGIALAASSTDLRPGRIASGLTTRLHLGAPRPLDVGVAILGLLGLTTALDSAVGLLGLRDYGALAGIRDAIAPLPIGSRILFAGLLGIGPGVTEELFFRGYLLNRIGVAQGPVVGLVASSLIFGLFHADPLHSVLSAAMGFYLGLSLLYGRSLWVPIAAHIVNNATAALTVTWSPSDLQAALLIPFGLAAGTAAIVLLAWGKGSLSGQRVVW